MNKDAVAENVANMSVGAVTATGLVGYFENHATLFSLLISAVGVLAAIIFYWLSYQLRKKELDFRIKSAEKLESKS